MSCCSYTWRYVYENVLFLIVENYTNCPQLTGVPCYMFHQMSSTNSFGNCSLHLFLCNGLWYTLPTLARRGCFVSVINMDRTGYKQFDLLGCCKCRHYSHTVPGRPWSWLVASSVSPTPLSWSIGLCQHSKDSFLSNQKILMTKICVHPPAIHYWGNYKPQIITMHVSEIPKQ